MAKLDASVHAALNTAFSQHFDGVQPISLKHDFAATGANLQSVAQQLTFNSAPAHEM